ncbi:MAG: class I SAM-dependent methyltransferase [Cyclobacteriaceae bacterium]
MEQQDARTLVETGVMRNGLRKTKGDGASTVVYGLWAKQHQAMLHSVDIDPVAIEAAKNELEILGLDGIVHLTASDSVAFLKAFPEPVDFLYLDSYDYDKKDIAIQQASQLHHLKEFKSIESKLHSKSLVLIDDCDLPGGGKGKQVIEYMKTKSWKIISDDYQVLLGRNP